MALTRLREDWNLPEDGWSPWIRAMIPALGEEDQYFIRRADGQVGYRYKYIRSHLQYYAAYYGIYEWKAVRSDQPSKIVYVGSAYRAGDTSLRDRISQYCTSGSHKKSMINDALTWGYKLWVRVKPSRVNTRRTAAEEEDALLAQYNYAWNATHNAVRSILLQPRPLRETCKLPEDGWSPWKKAMVPWPDQNFTEREGNVGYRLRGIGYDVHVIPAYYECGIYEWQARKTGQPDRVVCVGSTCWSKNETLRHRIREEYCIEGSRKRDLINDALNRGYELWFHFKVIVATRGVACAEDHENSLLAQFDYAWNTRNILP